jgi:glutaredoxin
MDYFRSKGFEFTEKNVEKEPEAAQEMIDKSHQQAIPVIDIDGKIIVGYNIPEINAALTAAA